VLVFVDGSSERSLGHLPEGVGWHPVLPCKHPLLELPRGLGSFVVGLIICSTSISRHTQQANHFLDEQEAGMQVVVVVVVKTLLCHNSS
jgi:hypothetical protein